MEVREGEVWPKRRTGVGWNVHASNLGYAVGGGYHKPSRPQIRATYSLAVV